MVTFSAGVGGLSALLEVATAGSYDRAPFIPPRRVGFVRTLKTLAGLPLVAWCSVRPRTRASVPCLSLVDSSEEVEFVCWSVAGGVGDDAPAAEAPVD